MVKLAEEWDSVPRTIIHFYAESDDKVETLP